MIQCNELTSCCTKVYTYSTVCDFKGIHKTRNIYKFHFNGMTWVELLFSYLSWNIQIVLEWALTLFEWCTESNLVQMLGNWGHIHADPASVQIPVWYCRIISPSISYFRHSFFSIGGERIMQCVPPEAHATWEKVHASTGIAWDCGKVNGSTSSQC